MGYGDTVKVGFDSMIGKIVIRQGEDIIVVFPCETQAVITGLMQAYADSVDVEKPSTEQQGMK